ncbi:DUF262 domain-containing protein [Vibrio maritimus]|uniref:DUF262 domain-containing protein n=1 Tax=Vibrio maritimus TaxID=990268 RepID=UPI00373645B0
MKINISEPDLGSIVRRVSEKVIDLQPDFQRGDVWATEKRKKLVDSILRGWQVPPIHVIRQDELLLEVLDGQQRLRAVVGFFNDEFPVSGKFEPIDEELVKLHGMYYSELPENIKRRVDFYSIRILEVYDYKAGETGELFNRLNQSLNLTAAEKRNAQVGATRAQIKSLANSLYESGLDSKFIGFSNTRLAHDDLFARLCLFIEKGGVKSKVSDSELYERYRKDDTFQDDTIKAVEFSISLMAKIKEKLESNNISVHITKASFFSWLLFISQMYIRTGDNFDDSTLCRTFISLESKRYNYKNNIVDDDLWINYKISLNDVSPLFSLFNERASSRVMITSSLLIRDWCISIFYILEGGNHNSLDKARVLESEFILNSIFDSDSELKSAVENMADQGGLF